MSKLFKPHHVSTIKKVAGIVLVGGVVASAGLLYAGHQALKPTPVPKTPVAVTPAFSLDPAIKQMGVALGIPESDLVAGKAHFGDSKNACPKVISAIGCYNGEITIDQNPQSPLGVTSQTVLAHEYMHYVWDHKVDQATKDQVNAFTQGFYTRYQANVASRFNSYDAVATSDIPNERQAIFCTEIRDSRLPAGLLNYCKTYLPNRNALPSYF